MTIQNSYLNIDQIYKTSMEELDEFFEFDWTENCPKLVVVPDRKTIDEIRGEKTPNWLIGWANKRVIHVLCPENFESESSHEYSEEKYIAFIKHELAHCFTNILVQATKKPIWLMEGVSIFLSGQNAFETRPEKLSNFIEYYDNEGENGEVYREAGFAVEFLIEKYGKGKLFELLKRAKTATTSEEFAKLFESVYGFNLRYEQFSL